MTGFAFSHQPKRHGHVQTVRSLPVCPFRIGVPQRLQNVRTLAVRVQNGFLLCLGGMQTNAEGGPSYSRLVGYWSELTTAHCNYQLLTQENVDVSFVERLLCDQRIRLRSIVLSNDFCAINESDCDP